ncbi:MAG: glycosyltransferase family 4 protein [Burkholderiaceae bacterium]|nr:glycosyltransferase family 4 protein [Burkholderiaceae bacterium]
MRILTFTTLYPNAEQPNHGVFVENRLRHLLKDGRIQAHVLAPVPWFPLQGKRYGRYGAFARVPRHEVRHGIEISHPRFPVIPRVGMAAAPYLLAHAMRPAVRELLAKNDFDLIDAHYFYPDGVAAAMLGQYFKKPVVITARGSDISVIPQYRLPRKMIAWAAGKASGMITVCQALRDAMLELGLDGERIVSLRNGVDLELFRPGDRTQLRQMLKLDKFTLLAVGQLVEHKGQALIIEALPALPDAQLLLAGTGPDRERLEQLATQLGVRERVNFLGAVPHAELAAYYGAADAMVLASSREGWANVLLESMACGTPVVASRVWGTPEVVASPDAGVLMSERSARGVAEAVLSLRAHYPQHAATRRYAEGFSWHDTTQGQIRLFEKATAEFHA